MNLYGVVTGTNDYALNVSLPPGFQLCIGDTITINPINANTGSATLSVGGMSPLPLTLNGGALTAGQLEAGKDRQCTFKGSGFACDNAGGAGGASFVGTSSNLTLGDGSAGIVPAGNFGNLSAADIPIGIDAAKLADGSVSNAELQTLSDISTGSTIQAQINGKAATPTGTPNGSKYLRDDNSWQTPSATDATKMPLTGGQFTGLASTKITPTSCVVTTWTTIGSVSGFTQCVLEVEVAGSGSWVFNWDGSTLTARAGTATPFVVNGTGAYEIGVRVNSNNVQVYMGGGIGTKNGGLVALKGH